MFSLSRYAPWLRNFALIASKKHRYNLIHLKSGVIAVAALPYVRAFSGESDNQRRVGRGRVGCCPGIAEWLPYQLDHFESGSVQHNRCDLQRNAIKLIFVHSAHWRNFNYDSIFQFKLLALIPCPLYSCQFSCYFQTHSDSFYSVNNSNLLFFSNEFIVLNCARHTSVVFLFKLKKN